jgi:hypothetical protein
MSEPSVPSSEASSQLLKELAGQTGQPMPAALDKALDACGRCLTPRKASLERNRGGWGRQARANATATGRLLET